MTFQGEIVAKITVGYTTDFKAFRDEMKKVKGQWNPMTKKWQVKIRSKADQERIEELGKKFNYQIKYIVQSLVILE